MSDVIIALASTWKEALFFQRDPDATSFLNRAVVLRVAGRLLQVTLATGFLLAGVSAGVWGFIGVITTTHPPIVFQGTNVSEMVYYFWGILCLIGGFAIGSNGFFAAVYQEEKWHNHNQEISRKIRASSSVGQ